MSAKLVIRTVTSGLAAIECELRLDHRAHCPNERADSTVATYFTPLGALAV